MRVASNLSPLREKAATESSRPTDPGAGTKSMYGFRPLNSPMVISETIILEELLLDSIGLQKLTSCRAPCTSILGSRWAV